MGSYYMTGPHKFLPFRDLYCRPCLMCVFTEYSLKPRVTTEGLMIWFRVRGDGVSIITLNPKPYTLLKLDLLQKLFVPVDPPHSNLRDLIFKSFLVIPTISGSVFWERRQGWRLVVLSPVLGGLLYFGKQV